VLLGVARRAKYGKRYFVKWDNQFEGRWYEANIHEDSNGKYGFTAHDGDGAGEVRTALEIAKLGEQSEKGDLVLSYYKNKRFAMPGVHMETKTNKTGQVLILVKYNHTEYGEEWEDASVVHKLVTLQSILNGTFLILLMSIVLQNTVISFLN